jgi:ComF family protein
MALHSSRRRQRGYNQSELLARELSRATGLPIRNDLLVRARSTTSQTSLSWSERQRNVAGAFALRPGAASALTGRRVLLLDDIITSGATTQAAALALREARPAAIYALAVARPLRPSSGEPAREP